MIQTLRRARRLASTGALALVVTLTAAWAYQGTPQERFDALMDRKAKAQQEFRKQQPTGELTSQQRKELSEKRPGREFIPEFEAIATDAKGTDVAALARLQVLQIHFEFGQKEPAGATLDTLLSDSIESKELKDLPMLLMYNKENIGDETRVLELLDTLFVDSPHDVVKAPALFTTAQIELASKDAETKKRARSSFERVVKEYGSVKDKRSSYKDKAEAVLFELDHLQIGSTAPDFETTDENGVKFKLSDYRGKVVVLDFWGMW